VRFAALVHDLGKGETPAEILPRHIGHEQRSVTLIEALCKRLRIPNDFRDVAVKVARFHSHCHRAFDLRPGTLLETLMSLDAFRQPGHLEEFLLACEADIRGRTGLEDRPYPQADLFRAACAAARAVNAQALAEQGLQGAALGERLRELRTQAVAQVCAQFTSQERSD
jgi:tRNA nucleotidyltransferase (CCA-adding enzyme)